jgi:hypothetical protein
VFTLWPRLIDFILHIYRNVHVNNHGSNTPTYEPNVY